MMPLLCVLGGSSPFTVRLIDALADPSYAPAALPPMELVLSGRNEENLALVRQYATHRLEEHGWRCRSTVDMARALDGATVVLHQIRYGDLALRQSGEELCAALNLHADETLGAAALLMGICGFPDFEITLASLRRHCPDAWVLNLSNPLSAWTAIMAREMRLCAGLCELPSYTVGEAAAFLGVRAVETDEIIHALELQLQLRKRHLG